MKIPKGMNHDAVKFGYEEANKDWIEKIDKLILFYSNPVDAVKRDALEELKGEKE